LEAVRDSTARVVAAACHVRIDDEALQALGRELLPRLLPSGSGDEGEGGEGVAWDAEGWHYNADAAADGPLTAQYVLVLDALNWCFWPTPGEGLCNGVCSSTPIVGWSSPMMLSVSSTPIFKGLEYEHLARGLKHALERDAHALDAERLACIDTETVASWIDPPSLALPQLAERTRKVQEVGRVLLAVFGGQAVGLVRAARGSAERLVALVTAHFPGFRDEAVYRGEQVN
jgi:hypothetical protein